MFKQMEIAIPKSMAHLLDVQTQDHSQSSVFSTFFYVNGQYYGLLKFWDFFLEIGKFVATFKHWLLFMMQNLNVVIEFCCLAKQASGVLNLHFYDFS